MCKNLFLCI